MMYALRRSLECIFEGDLRNIALTKKSPLPACHHVAW
jgi:hypothetical protein